MGWTKYSIIGMALSVIALIFCPIYLKLIFMIGTLSFNLLLVVSILYYDKKRSQNVK